MSSRDHPLAFSTRPPRSSWVAGSSGRPVGDRFLLVLRSIIWSEQNAADVTRVLDEIGLAGRYAVLYLDDTDELHVIRDEKGVV